MRGFVPGPKEFPMKKLKCWKHRAKGRREYTERDVENLIERLEATAEYKVTHAEALARRDHFGWGPDNTPDGRPPVYRQISVDQLLEEMDLEHQQELEEQDDSLKNLDESLGTGVEDYWETSQDRRLLPERKKASLSENGREKQPEERRSRSDRWDKRPEEHQQECGHERESERQESKRSWGSPNLGPETTRGRRRGDSGGRRARESPTRYPDERRGRQP